MSEVQTPTIDAGASRHATHVLVVDDDDKVRDALVGLLKSGGLMVSHAGGGVEAIALLQTDQQFDVLLVDLRMPGMSGLELLEESNRLRPDLEKIVITGYGSRDDAVKALQLGVKDFLTKPVLDRHRLVSAIERAAEVGRLRRENLAQSRELAAKNRELEQTVEQVQTANTALRHHYQQMRQDLITAAKIQRHLLPSQMPTRSGYRFAARFQPSERVSGDFYQIITLDPAHLLIFIADVAGHGVSAAMLTVFLSQSIEAGLAEIGEGIQPGELLAWLNRHLVALHDDHTPFITMLCGHLDLASGWINLASAGHEAPLLHRAATGRVEPVDVAGIALGLIRDVTYSESIIDMAPGDQLLLYTDGITEALSPEDEEFGTRRLSEVFEACPPDADQTLDRLIERMTAHIGSCRLEDDLCLLLVQRMERRSARKARGGG